MLVRTITLMARVPPWERPGGRLPPHPDQARIIREAREGKGWKQHELAEQAGISQPYLCRLETGKRAPMPRTARKLGALLGVTVPLPPIPFAETAPGQRQARQHEQEARQAAELARVQQEAREHEQRLIEWVMPRRTFAAFRAGRRF